jgi:hypothetical protein
MEQKMNQLHYRKLNKLRIKNNNNKNEKQKHPISQYLKLKKYNLYLYN